jgi:hypothetical protein
MDGREPAWAFLAEIPRQNALAVFHEVNKQCGGKFILPESPEELRQRDENPHTKNMTVTLPCVEELDHYSEVAVSLEDTTIRVKMQRLPAA